MKRLLLALFCALFALPGRADHIAGVDFTYECVNAPNEYLFTLTIFRDCAGIPITTYTSMIIESVCADTAFVVSVPPNDWYGDEITPICSDESTLCANGSWPGYEIYTFEFPVTFPAQCDDWQVAWTDCCRSVNITNIEDPQLADVYLWANIDNTGGLCNSSPVFNQYPIFFTCLGEQFCYNPLAVDPDGDSLVFSLVDPMQYLTIPVFWQPGFDAQQPLTSNPPVSIDSATGDLCMTATQQEITVLAIKVDEYRNGEYLGSIVRDIQMSVYNCDNAMPYLFGFDANEITANNVDTVIQYGDPLNISLEGDDPDYPSQSLGMYWDESIPGLDWDQGDPSDPTADIYWNPDSSFVSSEPYCFTVWIQDDGCPYSNTVFQTYCITVIDTLTPPPPPPPPPPQFDSLQVVITWSENVCADTCSGQLNALIIGGAPPHSFSWNSSSVTQLTGNTGICGGTYIITVMDSLDSVATDTAVLLGQQLMQANFSAPALPGELPAEMELKPQLNSSASAFVWQVNNTAASTDSVLRFAIETCGSYEVLLAVQNSFGCADTATTAFEIADANWPGTLPNVFTPNSDGVNDLFVPGIVGLSNFRLEIFDRWGARVHTSELPAQGWDGRDFAGLEMPSGMYFYVVSGSDMCNPQTLEVAKGTLQLLRD